MNNLETQLHSMQNEELQVLCQQCREAWKEDSNSEQGRIYPLVRREVRRRGLKEE